MFFSGASLPTCPTRNARSGIPAALLNAAPSAPSKSRRSTPVGITVIGAATPLDARRSATVPLGAITASHRLQYPVARSITKRFSRGESPGT